MNLQEAITSIEACTSRQELQQVMQQIIESFGFSSYNFIDAGRAYKGIPFYFGTTGPTWEGEYRTNQFVEIDPYIAKARRTNIPFDWKSITLPDIKRGPKSKIRRLMEAAFDFGFKEGLIVPYHFRDDIGRSHSVACVFYWKDKVTAFNRLLESHRINLHLIIVYFMQRSMQLLATEARDKKPVFTPAQDTAKQLLTDREREVLTWAALGKTSSETADILALGEVTVNSHLKNAILKIGASNKTHAVAKAITMGVIDI